MGTNSFIIGYSEFDDKRYNHLKTFKNLLLDYETIAP